MNDPVPTPAGVSPPSAASRSRFLHTTGIVALALCLSFLGLLNVATSVPLIRESLGPLVWEHRATSTTALVVTLLIALLVPIVTLGFCNRRGWLRWPLLTVLWSLVGFTFAYLMWDDAAVRRPLTVDELSPALPGDDPSYHILLRYAKNRPAAKAFQSPDAQLAVARGTGDIVSQPEKWASFLREHRAEVESGWATLAPVRAWWDELAASPRIGDLTPPSLDAPIPAFQPIRTYSHYAVAVASLQALDGHGDAAMATLMRLYTVGRKLEPNSRTLVRGMIAKVIQKMALQTAGFVLDHATVSPASRAAFAAEIASATSGPPGARRLILIEYALFQPMLSMFVGGDAAENLGGPGGKIFQRVVHVLGGIVVNPRATQNLVGDRYYQLAALAEDRRLGELEASKGPINRDFIGGYHVKNIGGRLIADMGMPAFSKVVKSYWDIDDLRTTLLTRLKG